MRRDAFHFATNWLLLLGLLLAAFGSDLAFAGPLERGRELSNSIIKALDGAASVQVVEHTNRADDPFGPNYQERTLATITLNQKQIEALRRAVPPAKDVSGEEHLNCIFDDHHTITIQKKDGSALILRLCFECGELEIDTSEGSRIMPEGWPESLARFVASLGMHPHGPWRGSDAVKNK